MTYDELIELALERLHEAEALLRAGHWSGAYYLCGYSVELILKAHIARQFRAFDIPDKNVVNSVWTHRLDKLLELAELRPDLEDQFKTAPRLQTNWNTALGWNEGSRYRKIDETEARCLIEALSDPGDGVFAWIRSKL
jgi:HEPN domain-containing protein